MNYQQAVTDLIKLQKNMMKTLEQLDRNGELPENLRVAKAEIIEWSKDVEGNGGVEYQPGTERVTKFAKALQDSYGMFDDYMRRNIAEYNVIAEQLPALYADPLGMKQSA